MLSAVGGCAASAEGIGSLPTLDAPSASSLARGSPLTLAHSALAMPRTKRGAPGPSPSAPARAAKRGRPPASSRSASSSPSGSRGDARSGSSGDASWSASDDLEGLVGEVLNGEISAEDARRGASHSAIEVLRSGFEPVVVEDARPAAECDDGPSLADAGDADELMRWLIAPVPLERFAEHIWERRAMVVTRNAHPAYYDGLLAREDVFQWLDAGKMRYGVNVDVTTYRDGARRTHNANDDVDARAIPPGEEHPDPPEESPPEKSSPGVVARGDVVRRRFEREGCSLRVLHPQRWRDPLWKLLSALETYWRCSTGCNAYLTPPDSQGFSPHFDDIDAFVLQLEGRKRWRVYPPRDEREALPRYSSRNFSRGEIAPEPTLEVELEPGDLLYMPRGTVHEARCAEGAHSLHVTVSTNQFNAYADVLELALPEALRRAVAEVPALRRCPPPDFLDVMGIVPAGNASLESDEEDEAEDGEGEGEAARTEASASASAFSGRRRLRSRRDAFVGVVNELAAAVIRRLPSCVDDAADELGKRLAQQRLPPPPSHLSAPRSGAGKGAAARVRAESVVRPMLADAGAARLVLEERGPVVYHCFENGRLYHMEGGDGEEADAEEDEAEAEEEAEAEDEEAEDEDAGDEEARDAASLRLGAVRVDAAFAPAVEALLSEDAVGAGVRVGDLLEAGGDAGGDAEGLVATVRDLVAAGVVALVER